MATVASGYVGPSTLVVEHVLSRNQTVVQGQPVYGLGLIDGS